MIGITRKAKSSDRYLQKLKISQKCILDAMRVAKL